MMLATLCFDGTLLFVGLFLCALALPVTLTLTEGTLRFIISFILLLLGEVCIVISATPFVGWEYLIWGGVTFIITVFILFKKKVWMTQVRRYLLLLAYGAIAVLGMREWNYYHFKQWDVVAEPVLLALVGDASNLLMVSQGKSWFQSLDEQKIRIMANIPKDARTLGLFTQIASLPKGNYPIIINSGLSDIEAGSSAEEYAHYLQATCAYLSQQNRQVWLLQLPVTWKNVKFLAAQRKIAARYQLVLLPRSILAAAVERGVVQPSASLTQQGHLRLAETFVKTFLFTDHKVD